MDYAINHREMTLGLAVVRDVEDAEPSFIVSCWNGSGRVSDAGKIDFLYFGESLEEAVLAIEEEVGALPRLLEHAQANIDIPGRVCWSEAALLLDQSHVYVVEMSPHLDAECDTTEFMTDDFEEAYAEAQNAHFESGGGVAMKTLSGVTLFARQIGYEDLDSYHPDFEVLRQLQGAALVAIEHQAPAVPTMSM